MTISSARTARIIAAQVAAHNAGPSLISEGERLWIEDKSDPKTRRLAAMMAATMLGSMHYTKPCEDEDAQIANVVRVALKIIRAVDEAA